MKTLKRQILNIDVGAEQKEIHAQYLKQVKLYHPDSSNQVHPLTKKEMSDDEKRLLFDSKSYLFAKYFCLQFYDALN